MYKINIKKTIYYIFFMTSCADYININKINSIKNQENLKPVIDKKHLSPNPIKILEPINVGTNCKGQNFKIPPVWDNNEEDNLYYLWFLDNKLIYNTKKIDYKHKNNYIIDLNIDKNFIENHFENKVPSDFYDTLHILEFIVSDKEFTIPESRYIDDNSENEKKHLDQVYWIFKLQNNPC